MNRIKRKKVGVNSSQMQISSFFKPISRSMSNSTDEKDKVLEFSTKCNTENQESKETVESPLLKRRKQTIENADPPRFHNLKPASELDRNVISKRKCPFYKKMPGAVLLFLLENQCSVIFNLILFIFSV